MVPFKIGAKDGLYHATIEVALTARIRTAQQQKEFIHTLSTRVPGT